MTQLSDSKKHHATTFTAGLVFVALLSMPSIVRAQEPWRPVSIRVGGLVADISSDVQVNGSLGDINTTIDFEDDLGFDSTVNTFFIDGTWRLARKHQLQVGFTGIKRDVSHARPTRTIVFRDQTFTVDTNVDAFVDTWYLTLNYGYAFIANPTAEFGFNIGFTGLHVKTGMDVSATGGSGEVSRDLADNAEFTAPVPLPGLFGNFRPHPRVELNGSLRVIKASIDKLDGTMWEARFGGDYKVLPGLGVGAAYYFNHANLDRHGAVWDGSVEYSFNGPQVYVSFGF